MLRQILCAVIFSLCFSAAVSANPLVQNAGFENWSNGSPDNWNYATINLYSPIAFDSFSINQASDPLGGSKLNLGSRARWAGQDNYQDNNTIVYQQVSSCLTNNPYEFSVLTTHSQSAVASGHTDWGSRLAIGIDPYGGTDPLSSAIIWASVGEVSQPQSLSVNAIALNQEVTLFIKNNVYGSMHVHTETGHGGQPVPVYDCFDSSSLVDAAELAPVPEPSTCLILLLGLGALIAAKRRSTL